MRPPPVNISLFEDTSELTSETFIKLEESVSVAVGINGSSGTSIRGLETSGTVPQSLLALLIHLCILLLSRPLCSPHVSFQPAQCAFHCEWHNSQTKGPLDVCCSSHLSAALHSHLWEKSVKTEILFFFFFFEN